MFREERFGVMSPHQAGKQFNVAVVGATGVVGLEFLKIATERRFPIKELKLLATERSAGKQIPFADRHVTVEATTHHSFKGADFVFISASGAASREYAPIARDAGAIVIDDSSVWRQDPAVPLVATEVNADDVEWHKGILAIPNCSTTPLVLCLWPLHKLNPVVRVVADTYQSVSGTGTAAVLELEEQSRNWAEGRESIPHVYPHQIAFNLLPHIDSFMDSGYTREEWKMMAETRKIMHEPHLPLSATCVRVPVFLSHSLAVHAEFERPMTADRVREILHDAPGVVVQDEPDVNLYPTPRAAAGHDPVYVGRIRQDSSKPNGIAMWISSDNIRKGAALNAIQIAEEMIKRRLV
jgi:aspartate-semialdehyde dehydrogenase